MKTEYEFVLYALGAMILSGGLFVIQHWFPFIPDVFITLTLWLGFGLLVIEGVLQLLSRLKKFRRDVKD